MLIHIQNNTGVGFALAFQLTGIVFFVGAYDEITMDWSAKTGASCISAGLILRMFPSPEGNMRYKQQEKGVPVKTNGRQSWKTTDKDYPPVV